MPSAFLALNVLAQHGEVDLSAKKLQPAAGLKVETFASDPLFMNPVAFTIDEKGRFFVSETHRYKDSIFDLWKMDERWKTNDFSWRTVEEREKFLAQEFATNLTFLTKDSEIIRLIEDKDGDGRLETSSVFADGFNKITSGTAAGVLARQGELWFTCIPDLWKFKYDQAGKKTAQELLHSGYGVHISVSGHDFHGLVMGPDGKLYFSVGDRGANVKSREGKQLELLQQGGVFRCNPDGSELEIYAIGLRNPQELAFDEFGNLWAHDNDTSGDDPARVMHVVEGGDYGWRQSYQFMEGFGPWVGEKLWEGNAGDILPPAGFGAQGPSGLAAYPGVGLPEKYKGALLGCDFPQGVWAYFPQAKGASYVVTKEKFLWGFGATDVAFGPDCHVYISDWGKSYNMPDAGKIYRVFDPAQKSASHLTEVKTLLSEGMEKRSAAELGKLLGHADMRVRLEAQFALPAKSSEAVAVVKPIALGSDQLLARIHAIRVLGNVRGRAAIVSATQTLTMLLQDPEAEIRAQAIRALEPTDPPTSVLIPLLKDSDPRVRFHAAMSLGKLKKKEAAAELFEMLRENDDKDAFLRHAGVWALVNINDMLTIVEAGRNQENPLAVRHASLLCLRRMKSPAISFFLNDPEPRLVLEAARAINDMPIPEAMRELAAGVEDCKCAFPDEIKIPIFKRQINAGFRAGQKQNLVHIFSFIPKTNVPEVSRIEALKALADWETPGPLDRAVGLWRPVSGERAKVSPEVMASLLGSLLQTEKGKLALAALECARQLGIKDIAGQIWTLYQNVNTSSELRLEILKTLGELKTSELNQAVQSALAGTDGNLRAEAVKLAARLNPGDAAPLLGGLLKSEQSDTFVRAVFASLGELQGPAAAEILLRQLEILLAGKMKTEVQLDLLEAAAKHSSPSIQAALQKYKAGFSQSDPLAEFRVCLAGGNVDEGKKVFRENDAVGCLRCHSIKGKGGTVGPDLAGIAMRQSREQLLESILFPNKQISPGFENVSIVMKNGVSHAGLVKGETEAEVILSSPEDGELTLKKAEIEKRDRTLSAMPESLNELLSKRDLRNLVEYLTTLK